MSTINFILKKLNIKEKITISMEESENNMVFFIELPRKDHCCPSCGTNTNVIKDYRMQRFFLGYFLSNIPIYVNYHKRRYICPCCHKSFYEEANFIDKYQQNPNSLKEDVIKACCNDMSFSQVAKSFNCSITTALRWFSSIDVSKPKKLPEVFCIDEFKGNNHGQKYQVSLVDQKKTEK